MILLWLLAPLIEGPTQRGQLDRDPRQNKAERLETQNELNDGDDWERLLASSDEAVVRRGGSMMRGPEISLRGSRAAQLNWSIEGIPMADAVGGGFGLRSIDPRLFRRAHLLTATGAGVRAPIAGEIRISSKKAPRLRFESELSSQRDLSLLLTQRIEHIELGFSVRNSDGSFAYHDPRGTHYTQDDDRWNQRDNQHARRANISLRHRRRGALTGLLLTELRGGIAGTAHHPLSHVSEREQMLLAYHRRRQTIGSTEGQLRFAMTHGYHRLDDPRAELTGLAGLQPRSAQSRAIAQWQSRGPQIGLKLQSKLEFLQQQAGPATGVAYGWIGAMEGAINWQRRGPWRAAAWLTGGFDWRRAEQLLKNLPLSLQNGAVEPLALRVNPGLSLGRGPVTARIIAGQRSPNIMELVGQHGGLRGNPGLQPERAISADIVSRFGPRTRRLQLSLYGRRSADLIDWTATSFGRAIAVNRARADILGAAIAWRHRYGPIRWRLRYRWQGEWAFDSEDDRNPTRLVGSPAHRLQAQTWWQGKLIAIGLAQTLRSAMQLDPSGQRLLGGGAQTDAALRWRPNLAGLTIKLAANNLFNEMVLPLTMTGYEPPVPVPLQDRWGLPLPGRTITIGLEVKQP